MDRINKISNNISKRKLLLFLFSFLIFAFSAVVYVYFPSRYESEKRKEMLNKVEVMADMTIINIAPALYFDDVESVRDAISRIIKLKDVAEIIVFNKSNVAVVHLKSDKFNIPEKLVYTTYHQAKTNDYLVHTKKIPFNEQPVGRLTIVLSMKDLNKEIIDSQRAVTALSSVFLIVGFFVVLWVSRSITRPLNHIISVFSKISSGDLSVRAVYQTQDEFGFLARSFNQMVDRLESTHNELEAINRSLEDRVKERTFDLLREIEERKAAEAQVFILNKELEARVEERTSQLTKAMEELRTEIATRKKMSRKLKFSDKVLRHTGALVMVLSQENRIIYSSNYSNYLIGIHPNELKGKDWITMFIKEPSEKLEKSKIISNISNADNSAQQSFQTEFFIRKGTSIWIRWDVMKGEKNTAVLVGHDVTDLINAEKVLIKANEEIEASLAKEKQLNDLKTRFVSMISHEYRTPLTVILNSTYILSKLYEMRDDESFNKYLNKITSSVDVMTKLLEEVLLIERSNSGNIKLSFMPIMPNSVMHDIIEDIQIALPKKQKFVMKELDSSLMFVTDSILFKQIFTNLISNACKYSEDGAEVVIEMLFVENKLSITVKDNGLGIPESDLPMIFNPFHRGSNIGAISGIGLGMAIVKRSVDALNGTIHVSSARDKGTTVVVELPNY